MSQNKLLHNFPVLHFAITNIIWKILQLTPIKKEEVFNQLKYTTLDQYKFDDLLLSIKLICEKKQLQFIQTFNNSYCTTNQFQFFLTKKEFHTKTILEFDIIDNNITHLIDKMFSLNTTISPKINNFFETLSIKLPQKTCHVDKIQFPFDIEDLTQKNLQDVQKLIFTTFKGMPKKEKTLLKASLEPQKYFSILEENEVDYLQYWVATEKNSNKVIALTGIYTQPQDPHKLCWLGWFAVDKDYRSKGYGAKLLIFSILQAYKLSKKTLHLYTYDSKKYYPAISLYKQFGFTQYVPNNKKNKKDLYFKIDIDTFIKKLYQNKS